MDSAELANLAVKHLTGNSCKAAKIAVLNACLESPDLVPQQTIDEAVARIVRGITRADEAKAIRA